MITSHLKRTWFEASVGRGPVFPDEAPIDRPRRQPDLAELVDHHDHQQDPSAFDASDANSRNTPELDQLPASMDHLMPESIRGFPGRCGTGPAAGR